LLFVTVPAVLAAGAVAVGAWFSHDSTKVCTLIAMDSAVSVDWEPSAFGEPDAVVVRLCADGTCEERSSGGTEEAPFGRLAVRLPQDAGPAEVAVRVTVTDAVTGRVLVEDRATAKLEVRHPNGEGCPPTAWTAGYRLAPDGLAERTDGTDGRG
jgi:hypothetical protein